MNKLNARQRRFIDALVLGKSGTQAATSAGYSARSAHVKASQLLRNPKVAAAIERAQARVALRVERTAADLSAVLWSIIDDPEAPPAARVSAAALEARRFREYSDKREVEHGGVVLRHTLALDGDGGVVVAVDAPRRLQDGRETP